MPIHGYPGNIVTANPTAPTVDSASGVWTTEQALQNIANWPMPLQQISRSLRFNSADSAYLNRTPASAGNRKTWTWSGWVKRSALPASGYYSLFGADSGSGASFYFAFDNSTQQIEFGQGATVYRKTTQVFRDPSAWYHVFLSLDTTQATANDRVKIYINGAQVTAFGTTNNPTQNADLAWNSNVAHSIGADIPNTGARNYFNGYLTEINFIDGLALDPSYFGFFDANGIWQPRAYKGAYGTNGFFLNFSDNSGVTSTTLGKDYSGNGNNWTPNNFSVTAGAGNDSLVDTPTNYGTDTGVGGEVRGNYATLNPISTLSASATLSNGNLDVTTVSSGDQSVPSTIYVSSGKWYVEFTCTKVGSGGSSVGILPIIYATATQIGDTTNSYAYRSSGNKRTNGSDTAYGASWTTNDVISIALDLDAGTLVFYKNGSTQGTAFSSISGTFTFAWCDTSGTDTTSAVANFGQRPFAYTAPSGFKALVTTNLPEPTIADGGEYFNTVLYTGNGASTGDTQVVSSVGFQPDLVWFKSRSNTYSHVLIDSARGGNSILYSDSASGNLTITGGITTFSSSGFTVAADLTNANSLNTSGSSNVAWNWKANGAGVSNTAGTITSTVSVDTTSGFSIVTYTGNGTSGATIGHGLGVAPLFFVVKRRDSTSNWRVYSSVLGGTKFLELNNTQAEQSSTTIWNDTAPTSTVFSVGNNADTNASGGTFVAYCFAAVSGYSAFGSYTGNGSADGPFSFCNFRPRYVLIKGSSFVSNWFVIDTSRSPYNVSLDALRPNLDGAEVNSPTTTYSIDILSNGFKLRTSAADSNTNAATFIWAAFAENPFKISRAR